MLEDDVMWKKWMWKTCRLTKLSMKSWVEALVVLLLLVVNDVLEVENVYLMRLR